MTQNYTYVGLGSNLGNRSQHIDAAVSELKKVFLVKRLSQVRESQPWGNPHQGSFLNAVCEIVTDLSARDVLARLLTIEANMGRLRAEKWGPRVIDLDLLICREEVLNESELTVPHPHLHRRHFVLEPLNDLCPTWRHPVLGRTILELLNGFFAEEA